MLMYMSFFFVNKLEKLRSATSMYFKPVNIVIFDYRLQYSFLVSFSILLYACAKYITGSNGVIQSVLCCNVREEAIEPEHTRSVSVGVGGLGIPKCALKCVPKFVPKCPSKCVQICPQMCPKRPKSSKKLVNDFVLLYFSYL